MSAAGADASAMTSSEGDLTGSNNGLRQDATIASSQCQATCVRFQFRKLS